MLISNILNKYKYGYSKLLQNSIFFQIPLNVRLFFMATLLNKLMPVPLREQPAINNYSGLTASSI